MKTETLKLSEIKINPENPRIIKDNKYKRLLTSIINFPEMLELRPPVVDENNITLGGNMRVRALMDISKMSKDSILGQINTGDKDKDLKLVEYWVKWKSEKTIPITRALGLLENQKNEFVIKDNTSFGDWDWDKLANEWDEISLVEWGLDIPFDHSDGSEDTGTAKNTSEHEIYEIKILIADSIATADKLNNMNVFEKGEIDDNIKRKILQLNSVYYVR